MFPAVAAPRWLERRGVGFLDYDTPEFKTVDHIAAMAGEKAAWFADTEGNIMCCTNATDKR